MSLVVGRACISQQELLLFTNWGMILDLPLSDPNPRYDMSFVVFPNVKRGRQRRNSQERRVQLLLGVTLRLSTILLGHWPRPELVELQRLDVNE